MNLPGPIDGIGKVQSNKINITNIKISGMASRDVDYESRRILMHPIAQDTSNKNNNNDKIYIFFSRRLLQTTFAVREQNV